MVSWGWCAARLASNCELDSTGRNEFPIYVYRCVKSSALLLRELLQGIDPGTRKIIFAILFNQGSKLLD